MDLEGHLTLEASREQFQNFVVQVNRLRVLRSIWVKARDTPLRGVTARLYTHALPGGSRVIPAGQMDDFIDVRPPDGAGRRCARFSGRPPRSLAGEGICAVTSR
jgi:hypothetical protein